MRVFVAGATGVIGRRLVPLLVARGHTVTGMATRRAGARLVRELGADPVIADAYDHYALAAAIAAAHPDAIIHQLSDLSGGDSAANARLRIHGTRNLVDAALSAGVRRIVAQSIAWAYEPGDTPAHESVALDRESDEPRRTTVAGVAALEDAIREVPEWVALRYGALYGSGTWFAYDGALADDARMRRLRADGDVTSFVEVGDAARAAADALDWPPGAVNVCDDEPAPGHVWVPAFCAAVGGPPPIADDTRQPWARGADNRRARELGWTPRYPTWRLGFAVHGARSAA